MELDALKTAVTAVETTKNEIGASQYILRRTVRRLYRQSIRTKERRGRYGRTCSEVINHEWWGEAKK